MNIVLEPITAENMKVYRDIRLRALKETPTAFGSTYAREVNLTEEEWLDRARRSNSERSIGLIAMDGDTACGLLELFLDQDDPTRAHLISMWTIPTHRRTGIARRLVEAVTEGALQLGVRTLLLFVTSNNTPAIAFYESLGFTRTGHTIPYPNDPTLIEHQMARPIA